MNEQRKNLTNLAMQMLPKTIGLIQKIPIDRIGDNCILFVLDVVNEQENSLNRLSYKKAKRLDEKLYSFLTIKEIYNVINNKEHLC